MKLAGRIICSILLVLASLLSLIFAFVELRSMFATDFVLFNNAAAGFFGYLFRSLFFMGLIVFSIYMMVVYLKNKEIKYIYSLLACSLFFGSLFSLFFYTNFIYFVIIFITLLPVGTLFIRRLFIIK